MEFNYGKERKKMEDEFAKFKKEYTEAYKAECDEGKIHKSSLEESLSEMHDFDKEVLNGNRKYVTHTISYYSVNFKDDHTSSEEHSPLIKNNLESFSSKEDEICERRRYGWIDNIDNFKLYQAIKSLSQKDIEVLTLKIIDQKSQVEIAALYGVSNAAISKRIKRIVNKLKDFYEKG